MIKICFVCHGNICRSPMAEYLMKEMVNHECLSDKIYIESKATSNEEIGNDIHDGTKRILNEYNIPYSKHESTRLTKDDYNKFDYFILMDENNMRNIKHIFSDKDNKIYKLLDFTNKKRDIADPWYTNNFDQTYSDIKIGCQKLLEFIKKKL